MCEPAYISRIQRGYTASSSILTCSLKAESSSAPGVSGLLAWLKVSKPHQSSCCCPRCAPGDELSLWVLGFKLPPS